MPTDLELALIKTASVVYKYKGVIFTAASIYGLLYKELLEHLLLKYTSALCPKCNQ